MNCPHCSKPLLLPVVAEPTTIPCPHCAGTIAVVPAAPQAAAPPVARPAAPQQAGQFGSAAKTGAGAVVGVTGGCLLVMVASVLMWFLVCAGCLATTKTTNTSVQTGRR